MKTSKILSNETLSRKESFFKSEFEFIENLGFSLSEEAKNSTILSENTYSKIDSSEPLVYTVIGKFKLIDGRLPEAFSMLKKAHRLAINQYSPDCSADFSDRLAYTKLELAVFFRTIAESETAVDLLTEAGKFTSHSKLTALIAYENDLLKFANHPNEFRDSITKQFSGFKSMNLNPVIIAGYLTLGQNAISQKEYKKAVKYLNKGLKLISGSAYPDVRHSFNNELGLVEVKKGNYSTGIRMLQQVYESSACSCSKSVTSEYIALANLLQGEYESAVNFAHEALSISLNNGIFDRIPSQAVFIGDIYNRKFQQPQRAGYFYKTASDYAMKTAEMGLPLKGKRLQAVLTYMDYIKSHAPLTPKKDTIQDILEFTRGKSWLDFTDIFKFNLIIYHRQMNRKIDLLLEKIDLSRASFNSKQTILKKRGFVLPNMKFKNPEYSDPHHQQTLQDYISDLDDKTWNSAVKTFETDAMKFLYAACNYNKRILSKELDFSYPHTLLKMKELEISSYRYGKKD